MPDHSELSMVMPVYNEQDSIRGVIARWDKELASLGIDYKIHAYNDGSKDESGKILDLLQNEYPRLEVHHKRNSGHGPTILTGYRMSEYSDWLFQIDSDDEMGPEGFKDMWSLRDNFDFLLGKREDRSSPCSRRIISLFSRLTITLFYGQGVYDVNSPFRLMRTERFRPLFKVIPDNTFAPNIIVSGFSCLKKMRIHEIPVAHRQRKTGVVSIKKWGLFKAALRSFWQTIHFRLFDIGKIN